MRPWLETIIEQRASPASPVLRPIQVASGWVIEDSTSAVTQSTTTLGPGTSWQPDLATTFAVRQLEGMCAPVDLQNATRLLGPGTRLESDDVIACHYSVAEPRRDLWLSASSHVSDSAAIAWVTQNKRTTALSGLGAAARLIVESRNNCSTVGAARSVWTFYVSACGAGFGLVTDSARLRPLAKRLIGEPYGR